MESESIEINRKTIEAYRKNQDWIKTLPTELIKDIQEVKTFVFSLVVLCYY